MKYKNYYKILELKNDRVSDDEIKSAYRRLAKKYNPDINPGDAVASEKFKDVNEAYQILGNETSKKKYDRIHSCYRVKNSIDDTKEKLNADGFSEMFEMMFGKKEKVKSNAINGADLESQISITMEEAFFGAEKKIAFKTLDESMKSISFKIPKGVKNGTKIRIANQGKPGKNGGANGNLYIKINIMKNNIYDLNGFNIVSDLYLTPWEAALGTKISFKNIDSLILVQVPKGIQSGEKLRIAGGGFWKNDDSRGDLILNVKIMVPKELSDKEIKLFNELSEVSKFEPRKNITKEKE